MRFHDYSARLASIAWRDFTRECRKRAGEMCCMCGSPRQLQCHHMRYLALGTPNEWKEIAVLCNKCHDAYHGRVKTMPAFKATRDELMIELAIVLAKAGRSTSTYDNHGDELSRHWLATPIRNDGLYEAGNRGKTKRPIKVLRRMYWNSKL